jgi:hypothetical protein
MSRHPGLSGSWDKLWWAEQHFKTLKAGLDAILDPKRNPIPFDSYAEDKSRSFVFCIADLPTLTNAALMLGDVFHNFRSSLDHMCWFLVKNGSNPKPKRPNLVQFPMAKSAGDFDDWVDRRLPGVPDEQRAIIKTYQPYRRGKRSKAIRRLQEFSNRDKHRLVIPSVMAPKTLDMTFDARGCVIDEIEPLLPKTGLKVGTKIARVYVTPIRGATQCEVEMNGEFWAYPALSRRLPIKENVDLIGTVINEILLKIEETL